MFSFIFQCTFNVLDYCVIKHSGAELWYIRHQTLIDVTLMKINLTDSVSYSSSEAKQSFLQTQLHNPHTTVHHQYRVSQKLPFISMSDFLSQKILPLLPSGVDQWSNIEIANISTNHWPTAYIIKAECLKNYPLLRWVIS